MFKLIAILIKIADFVTLWLRENRKKELKDAANESLNENDQRKIENALGVSGDPVKYDGVYERDRKEKKT